jgi:hypothetical protein
MRARSSIQRVNRTAQLPVANILTDGDRRYAAYARTEVDEELTPPLFRSSRSKSIAKEIELLVGMTSPPVIILTVDDLRLLGMKFQSTLSKTALESILEALRLLLTDAVAEGMVLLLSLAPAVGVLVGFPLFLLSERIKILRTYALEIDRAWKQYVEARVRTGVRSAAITNVFRDSRISDQTSRRHDKHGP